jgi:diguanylate cyclase (GGDEF)-like protein/PAS domain S-box-containing protein
MNASLNDPAADFGLTDVLLPRRRAGDLPFDSIALDARCVQLAVLLQSLSSANRDATLVQVLDGLREAALADVAFLASFDAQATTVVRVEASCDPGEPCDMRGLLQRQIADFPYLQARLEPLQLSECADAYGARPAQRIDAKQLVALQLGSLLVVCFAVEGKVAGWLGLGTRLGRQAWDKQTRLLLKLLGASLGIGLERLQVGERLARLEEREPLAQDCAHEGLWDFDVERSDTRFSPAWRAMLGYADDALQGAVDWRSLVHPDDMPAVHAAMREHVAGNTPRFESVHRMRHRDGSWRWVSSRARATVTAQGRLSRVVGVELDITAQRDYEDALFREKEASQFILQSVGDGVITTDAQGLIDFINPVASNLTGWRLDDAIGQSVEEVFRVCHEETCEPLENPVIAAIRRMRLSNSTRPQRLVRSDGNELFIHCTSAPVRDGFGQVAGGVLVFRDVSESRELNRKLDYQASHDVLTGLVNRREFEARLERALQSACAGEAAYALVYLDIDQFRMVNDGCGHVAGDALLTQLGALLKSRIRWRDTLARLGGDEFGVLLESCSLDEAMHTAEVLRQAVQDFRFSWEDRAFRLGASLGVVPITADIENVAAVVTAADSACATAKELGRNRVYSFAENDLQLRRRRTEMQWAARITTALEEGRFELFGMPILALQVPERGAHLELLLRLRDDQGHIITPFEFIAAAERYNMMQSIDRWVIEHAFRWLASDRTAWEGLDVCAINLSGQSLSDDKFLPWVVSQFERWQLDPKRFCFEITETSAVESFERANDFIRRLRELGCHFSLDDFGAGMSSFGYLKSFPVDYLKIDGHFVRNILTDEIDREMVRAITQIGHITGKRVVAEFAESEAVIDLLRELGVDYAQGYGVARPERVYRTTGG